MNKCRVCGCTDDDCSQCIEAQGFPCWWVEDDLCSRCSDNEFDLYSKFAEEFTKEWMQRPFMLQADNLTMWSIASTIQFACRHPNFKGFSSEIAKDIANKIFDRIATTPALKEVAEKGWDSKFDLY